MTVLLDTPVVEKAIGCDESLSGAYSIAEDELEDGNIEEALKQLAELDLPVEDGIPLETNWHRIEMNLFIDSIHYLWRDRSDYFAGGNMFIYFNLQQARNRDYRGPDVFLVKDVDGTQDREAWIVWEEQGRYPDVIVELASPSTIRTDLNRKKALYEHTFRTQEYFCYDPNGRKLYGWKLAGRRYVTLPPNSKGWLWSEEIGAWVGTWQGTFQRTNGLWLRLYTDDGQLVPTLAEAEKLRAEREAQRAETEAQRAEAEAQRAKAAEDEAARLREVLAQHGIADE